MDAPRVTLGFSLALVLFVAACASAREPARDAVAEEPQSGFVRMLAGTWFGTLDTGAARLRLVLNVEVAGDSVSASIDSPDQGVSGIRVGSVVATDSSLVFDVPDIYGRYEGRFSADRNSVDGRWQQGMASLPLSLERVDSVPAVERPQEPHPPFPYRVEEVQVLNATDDVVLAGTLTLPEGDGPHPGAVLISGSGPQDRDEALFGHRPFYLLADHLTRQGVAVLRYDDRGYAGSTGTFSTATTEDFARDARAALEWLRAHENVDPDRVGFIGHSEGGLVAPLASQPDPTAVAFLVLLGAPAVDGEAIIHMQDSLIARASGADDVTITLSRERNETIFEILKREPDLERAAAALREVAQSMKLTPAEEAQLQATGMSPAELIERQIAQLNTAWFRFFLTHDPVPALRGLGMPILALTGERDLQVPPDQNIPLLVQTLEAYGHPASEARVLPGLNHLLQTAPSGHPNEYGTITETISPTALSAISDWILNAALAER